MLSYLRLCLATCAGVAVTNDHDEFTKKIPIVGKYVRRMVLEAGPDGGHFIKYLHLASRLLETTKGLLSLIIKKSLC